MPTLLSESAKHTVQLLSSEEFLDWLQPGVHADLIDGEISMHSPVKLNHARLIKFLYELLQTHCRKHSLGEIFTDVVAVRLGSRNTYLPDLFFIPHNRLAELPETHIPFAPPFVVEALSPHTAHRDVGPKFAAYEEHGVNEYWVLDPDTLAHRFYRREGELLVEYAQGAEWIDSREIPGLRVRRDWLNPTALPDPLACLNTLPGG